MIPNNKIRVTNEKYLFKILRDEYKTENAKKRRWEDLLHRAIETQVGVAITMYFGFIILLLIEAGIFSFLIFAMVGMFLHKSASNKIEKEAVLKTQT